MEYLNRYDVMESTLLLAAFPTAALKLLPERGELWNCHFQDSRIKAEDERTSCVTYTMTISMRHMDMLPLTQLCESSRENHHAS